MFALNPFAGRSLSRRAVRRAASRSRGRSAGLLAEQLEPRALLTVTPTLTGTALGIVIAGGDTATLTYDGAAYSVNGTPISGTVDSISVTDDGNAKNVFQLASDIPGKAGLKSISANVGGALGGKIDLQKSLVTVGSVTNQFTVSSQAGALGSISLAGNVTGAAQALAFVGPVSLAADVTVKTTGKPVNFIDTLDGNYTLTGDTGTGGQVNFIRKVGGAAPLAGLKILSGGATQATGATLSLDASKAKGAKFNSGISVNDGCSPVTLNQGGSVQNFPYYGIVVRGGTVGGTNATLQGFTLAANGQAGIGVQQGANANLTIGGTGTAANTITGGGVAGIVIDGQGKASTITIQGNSITVPVLATTTTTGILLGGSFSPAANSLSLLGNTIAFDATGPAATGPTFGIVVSPAAAGTINAVIGNPSGDGNTVTGAAAGAGTTGVLLAGDIDGTSVVGNSITACSYGLLLSATMAAKTTAIVQNNTIDGTDAKVAPQIGLLMSGATGVAVGGGNGAGNTVNAFPIGLYAAGTSTDSSVQGNVISATGWSTTSGIGILLDAAQGLGVGTAGTDTGNTINDACTGLYATGDLTGTTVSANTIQDVYQGVVLFEARNLPLGGTNGNGNILGQSVAGEKPFLIGIYAAGDSTGTSVAANRLHNAADNVSPSSFGLFLDGATSLAVGGAISGAVNPGNTVEGFSTGCYAQNTLTGTFLEGNVFSTGKAPTATRTGLQLMSAQGLTVGGTNDQNDTRGNTFAQCTSFGGYAAGTSTGTTLSGNIVSGDNYGFYADGATGLSLFSNHLSTNAAAGVTVVGAASETVLQSNRIYANTGGGIVLGPSANQGVAAPALASFTYDSSKHEGSAVGTLAGVAGKTYRIQYFTTPSILSAQGRTLLALASGQDYEDVTLSGSSAALAPVFSTASPNPGIAAGDVLTATATLLSGGPGSSPVATSAFSSQTATYGTAAPPLAVAFDTAKIGPGLGPNNVYVSIQPGKGPGGLSGFLVTYNSTAGSNRLVSFGLPSDVISAPLSLADITDPATGKPTLYVTEGVSLSTFVSYGKAMVPSSSAPSVIDAADPNYLTRFQQFELTRNYPGNPGDQGNLTHINYFTAPMSLANYASSNPGNLGTPLETKWSGITASTAQSVYGQLAAIPSGGSSTIGASSAVVRDAQQNVVRVIGPSTYTKDLPYPSLLDYVKSLSGKEPKIWNYNGFSNADGSTAYQVNFGGSRFDSTAGKYDDADNHLTTTVAADGTIKVYGTITITQTAGGTASQQYTATQDSPWMMISPNEGAAPAEKLDNFNLAIYGQAKTSGASYAAVSYPAPQWDELESYLVNAGADANADPMTTTQGLLVGEVTSAILLGFANAAPTASPYGPKFSGTIYPAGYSTAPGTPTITYDGLGGNPPPIFIKNMRSREWWNFAPTPGTPSAVTLQPTLANYNQYASIIQTASKNETYTIPYSDRLGTGPLIQTVQYGGTAVGTIVVGLAAPISAP